ncbi:MAG: RNA-binding S4 domain-containing protein [Methyloversatilis sp.]|uniref:RNA-binding S4 domain-containing protein n=1 Tax=Methyloversatilis sp. TaxID=2569862 RepID=UPI00273534EF|nr:RNA-binding S4 domain-containing protein [Methyloversatilis sp.]MDP3872897.1 RNA-binding S4 domain-containing protein [Methyloversatilis sp.]
MSGPNDDTRERLRLDKWLWAARFFKTRTLAADAIDAGRIQLNEARAKPSREVRIGDRLDIQTGELRYTVIVQALSGKRGPAEVARTLYEETPESMAAREAAREQRRLQPEPSVGLHGRPTKTQRREIDRLRARIRGE